MINTKQAARLRYLVSELVTSAREDEMKGAQAPELREVITANLKSDKLALYTFIASITAPNNTVAVPASVEQAESMRDVAEGYLKRRKK